MAALSQHPALAPTPTRELEPTPAPAPAPTRELDPTPAPAPAPAPAPTRELEPTPAPAPAPAPAPTRELEPTPAPAWPQGSGGGHGDVDVPTLLRLKDRMKEQFMEYNTAVAGQENIRDHEIKENFNQSATQDLERDLEDAKVSFQNKTMALQRTQIIDALRNKLKQDDEDSRLILETMKHIVLLSRTIIDYQQRIHQKEQQLIDIKRERLSALRKYGGGTLQQIHTMMKRQKEKQTRVNVSETEKMLHKLEKERQMVTIIQNVFQNVIFGSGVNWAEDPFLKGILLELEKNVHFQ